MQGLEVFESMGAASEEVKQTDESMQEVAVPVFETVGVAAGEVKRSEEHVKDFAVPGVAERTAPQLDGPKPTRFQRHNVAKQSGVPNIVWKDQKQGWEVNYSTVDGKGNKRYTGRKFSVKRFLGPGMDEAEAEAAALQAAKNFRAELVKQGNLSEPKPKDPNFTSELPGVKWDKKAEKWRVEITLKGRSDGRQNQVQGGYFTDKAVAESKALELRQQHGLERQVKAVSSLAELPVFEPKVPHPGVTWEKRSQQWHACCRVAARQRNFYVRPKDHSEEELERSFQVAVAWKKKQEKERETAMRVKAMPGKKQVR